MFNRVNMYLYFLQYTTLPPGPVPPATPKNAYGTVTMATMMSFYDALDTIAPYEPIRATYPITMEDMQQVRFLKCLYVCLTDNMHIGLTFVCMLQDYKAVGWTQQEPIFCII